MNKQLPQKSDWILNIGFLAICVGMLTVTFFERAQIFGGIVAALGAIMFILRNRARMKTKTAEQPPPASDSQKQKKFRVLVIACAFACVASPFALQYSGSGIDLPFWELAISSVISFFIVVGIIWLMMKLKK